MDSENVLSSATIEAYLDNRLNGQEKKFVEKVVHKNEQAHEMLTTAKERKSFLESIIPMDELSTNGRSKLEEEIADINLSLFKLEEEALTFFDKVKKILNKKIL